MDSLAGFELNGWIQTYWLGVYLADWLYLAAAKATQLQQKSQLAQPTLSLVRSLLIWNSKSRILVTQLRPSNRFLSVTARPKEVSNVKYLRSGTMGGLFWVTRQARKTGESVTHAGIKCKMSQEVSPNSYFRVPIFSSTKNNLVYCGYWSKLLK